MVEQKLLIVSVPAYAERGTVMEYLDDYLSQGWRVVSVTPFVCPHCPHSSFGGWIVVVIERNST